MHFEILVDASISFLCFLYIYLNYILISFQSFNLLDNDLCLNMSRSKRSVPRRNYKHFDTFGTTDPAVLQFTFQKTMDDDSLNLSLTAEEQEEFAEETQQTADDNGGEDSVLGAVGPIQSFSEFCSDNDKSSAKMEPENTSDEELELRIQLLEKRRDDLKKQQLRDRIKQLEEEVATLSGAREENKEKKKQKKKSGEVKELSLEKDQVTIKDLRKSKALNQKVDKQLKFLGFDQEITVQKSVDKKKKQNSKFVSFPDSDKTVSSGSQKGKSCLSTLSKSDKEKKKVIAPVSDSESSYDSDSDSDTSSSSSSSEDSYKKKKSKKSSKKKKSGLVRKSTDKVKNPQSFPHNYLQFEYVSKELKFKQLTFKQFVAGELEIIANFCKDKAEKEGRLKLLQKIAYFSSVYQWSAILDFYAAWLRQIEIGKKNMER